MKKILKYLVPMNKDGDFYIPLPSNSIPRYVACQPSQGNRPYLWIEIDYDIMNHTNAVVEYSHFHVFGTGHMIPNDAEYIGTWQDGNMVWHLYQICEE